MANEDKRDIKKEIPEELWETFEEILPEEYPAIEKFAGKKLSAEEKTLKDKEAIINALKTVVDPDIKVDVYNLGLIYKYEIENNGDVNIEMTLTSPTCPYANSLVQACADAIADLEGVGQVKVSVVWEPKWNLSMLSEEAKFDLDMI